MISPSSFAVFALKFLQKSMMFTPCGPRAVPTGGAGVAFPAAIWSFTIAWTFFMGPVYFSSLAPGPHPQRELTPMPRLGYPCPRLGIAAGALFSLRVGPHPHAERTLMLALGSPWPRTRIAAGAAVAA